MRADFLVELVQRRVTERYIGASYRLLWVVLSPLIPLLMNIAIFYFIARLPQVQAMGVAAYAAFMFSGLLPFRFVQRSVTDGCDLLTSNMEMLKSAAFPLPFLSLTAVGALLVDFAIQCVLMMILLAIAGQPVGWSILLLVPAAALMLAFCIGASFLFSVAGYLLRDLQEMAGMIFGALLYVTPTVYPVEAAPIFLQKIIWLNPLTHLVIIFRDALMPSPEGVHWQSWMVVGACAAVTLALGGIVIDRARRHVGDLV